MNDINQPYELKLTGITSVPIWTALISFAGGTLLFLLRFVAKENDNLVIAGFFYVVAAFIINLVVLLAMIIMSFVRKEQQKEILINTSIQLINIPITILYLYILFK